MDRSRLRRSLRSSTLVTSALVLIAAGACLAERRSLVPASQPPGPLAIASAPQSATAPSIVAGSDSGETAVIAAGPPILPIVDLSIGSAGCAVSKAGELWCWGDGDSGELGDGARTRSQRIPRRVEGIPGVRRVDSRHSMVCALHNGGEVTCWGSTGAFFKDPGRESWGKPPRRVPGLPPVEQIAVKSHGLLARTSDGRVFVWGRSLDNARLLTSPEEEISLRGAVDVVVNDHAGCARMANADVMCWSDIQFLGHGWGNKPRPVVPTRMPQLKGARRIALGYYDGCALMGDGTAKCWSEEENRKPNHALELSQFKATTVAGVSNLVSLAGGPGGMHCGVRADGTASCWGQVAKDQLGDGSQGRVLATPKPLTQSEIIKLEIGTFHACALVRSGGVKCWGTNQFSQLGDGTRLPNRPHPTDVAFPGIRPTPPGPAVVASIPPPTSAVASLAAGGDATCAAFVDGTARCWGDNSFGQLGNGGITGSVRPTIVDGLHGVGRITVGQAHACAIVTDHTVRCWGVNYYGELGLGKVDAPSPSPQVVPGLSNVASLAADAMTCTLGMDGVVRCWGDYDPGNGDPHPIGSMAPAVVPGLGKVVELGVHSHFACAKNDSAKLKCWGRDYGQRLGPGPAVIKDVSSLAFAGGSCVVHTDGTVSCWGVGNVLDPSREPPDYKLPKRIHGWTSVAVLSIGRELACGSLRDSSVQCQSRGPASLVPQAKGATQVVTGKAHACALMPDGRVVCWGENDKGQLGDGSTVKKAGVVTVLW